MTQTPKNPTNGDWARFRFSIVGSLFSSPPARRTQNGHPRSCRENMAPSRDRLQCPVCRVQHRTLVLRGATR